MTDFRHRDVTRVCEAFDQSDQHVALAVFEDDRKPQSKVALHAQQDLDPARRKRKGKGAFFGWVRPLYGGRG
jgi:hypothetical protein